MKQLKELKEMYDSGILSGEEFEHEKRIILSEKEQQKNIDHIRLSNPKINPLERGRLGSYNLLRKIGEGGQGSVYVGRHRIEGKAKEQGGDVAIKVLHAENQEMREMNAATQLEGEDPWVVNQLGSEPTQSSSS